MRSIPISTPFTRRPVVLAAALAAAAVLASCASSQLVNLWKDPKYPESPMQNVLVVAMKTNSAHRRVWEDNFNTALTRQGVTATPSYRLWPDAVPDTQQVIEAVRANGYDGVVVTHKLETEVQTRHVSGYTTTQPVAVQNPWTGWYSTVYQQVHHPGYTETERVVQHQTDVWSTKDGGRMVWTGVSRVIDPSSSEAVNKDITRMIIPELAKMHVLPGSPGKK